MSDIKAYTNKKGEKLYKFRIYVGFVNGKSKYVNRAGFKTKTEAKKAYQEVKFAAYQGEYRQESNLDISLRTFGDLYDFWFEQYKDTVRGSSYYVIKKGLDKNVYPYLKNKQLKNITLIDCQNLINKLLKTNPGNYVILSVYMKKILQYAVTLKLIPENPMNNVIKPREKKTYSSNNYYSKEELKTFLAYSKKEKFHIYVLFRLLAYSGMRIGELLALKVADIDFNTSQISITKTISSDADSRFELHKPKTTTGNRIISVDPDTINLVSTLIKDKKKDDFIFRFYGCSKPYSPRTVALWKNKIIKKANLRKISLHGFRHTYTSLLFESGVNIKEIQKQLGHSKVEMTLNVYTHLSRNNNDIGSKFDNYLNN